MRQAGVRVLVLILAAASPPLAAGPPPPGGSRLLLAGRLEAGYGSDDPGWFNYSRGSYTPQRLFRLALSAELRVVRRVALLVELRSDNLERPDTRAAYLRVRALERPGLDLQLGRVPPVVGSFARRYAGEGNPLIGTPLPYQYPTTLHEGRLSYGPGALLERRGFGGARTYADSYGAYTGVGLPLLEGDDWDTGVQARLSHGSLELALGATRGSAGDPVVRENNAGRQWAGRLQWRALFGLVLGASFSRGAYLADQAGERYVPPLATGRAQQRLWAADAEFSAGHTQLRAEALLSRWEAPTVRPEQPLQASGFLLEARQTLRPGLYAAARLEGLFFDELRTRQVTDTWDARVLRVEAGVGYSLRPDLRVKASYQHNWRDGGPRREDSLLAARASFTF